MKVLFAVLMILGQIFLVLILNNTIAGLPPIGVFLSPQHGFWQNASPTNVSFSFQGFDNIPQTIENKIDIAINERGVPHIFATNWEDALFAQGYMHARDRLFQMDFVSRLAAGRLSEWIGAKILPIDKKHRQLGLPVAAENMTLNIFSNKATKDLCMAYVAGINFYLANLPKSAYPIEYKMLNVAPEAWSVNKIALIYKYLSWDLSGSYSDAPASQVKQYLSREDYELLYSLPTVFFNPIVSYEEQPNLYNLSDILAPADINEDYMNFKKQTPLGTYSPKQTISNADYTKGSNSWVISTQKSLNGNPILCNDPHLGLNLPSSWYETQISIPNKTTIYGVSTPGIPFIMIGKNDNLAWGITNSERDLTDFYTVQWADKNKHLYQFGNEIYEANFSIEEYQVKNAPTQVDTIWSTHIGNIFPNEDKSEDLTIQWIGNIPSNEIHSLYQINNAKNIPTFLEGLESLYSPGLSFTYITSKDIGYIQQGAYPVKWERQGDFIMPFSPAYVWNVFIPQSHHPQVINPDKGFIVSANQYPTSFQYPYYLGHNFPTMRSFIIHDELQASKQVSIQDMLKLQTSNKHTFAKLAIQNILTYTNSSQLSSVEKKYYDQLMKWDFVANPNKVERIYFNLWWDTFKSNLYGILFQNATTNIKNPQDIVLLQKLISSLGEIEKLLTKYKGYNINIEDIVQESFKACVVKIETLTASSTLQNKNNAQITHLMQLEAFSKNVDAGGSIFSINAIKGRHGPSMRFVTSFGENDSIYLSYPGGQSGNPGSSHYMDGIPKWQKGEYNVITTYPTIEEMNNITQQIQF